MKTTFGILAALLLALGLNAQVPAPVTPITNTVPPISPGGFAQPLEGRFAQPLTSGFAQPLTGGVARPLTGGVQPLTGTPQPITNSVPPITTTPVPLTGRTPFLSPNPLPPAPNQNQTIVVGDERPLTVLRSNNFFFRTNANPGLNP